jgi:hypothetical protein
VVTHEISFICSICGESVEVTTSVVDEFGNPAHVQCYVEKLARESELPQGATSEQLRSVNLLRARDDLKRHPNRWERDSW